MQQRKVMVVLISFLCIVFSFSFSYIPSASKAFIKFPKTLSANSVYNSLHLPTLGLSKQAYITALKGFQNLINTGKLKNDSILSIIDFSLPSTAKRLFVLDIKHGIMLFNTYVAHGKKSGNQKATFFSNKPESFKSSLGFYITAATYFGKNGYSLKLEGEEKGFNDNAYNRGIVMHSADYVSEDFIKFQGRIGRSEGCPAIPRNVHIAVIETIKEGSCLFMYSPNNFYLAKSKLLNTNKSGSLSS
jgi:hypothetical protein